MLYHCRIEEMGSLDSKSTCGDTGNNRTVERWQDERSSGGPPVTRDHGHRRAAQRCRLLLSASQGPPVVRGEFENVGLLMDFSGPALGAAHRSRRGPTKPAMWTLMVSADYSFTRSGTNRSRRGPQWPAQFATDNGVCNAMMARQQLPSQRPSMPCPAAAKNRAEFIGKYDKHAKS